MNGKDALEEVDEWLNEWWDITSFKILDNGDSITVKRIDD